MAFAALAVPTGRVRRGVRPRYLFARWMSSIAVLDVWGAARVDLLKASRMPDPTAAERPGIFGAELSVEFGTRGGRD